MGDISSALLISCTCVDSTEILYGTESVAGEMELMVGAITANELGRRGWEEETIICGDSVCDADDCDCGGKKSLVVDLLRGVEGGEWGSSVISVENLQSICFKKSAH